MKNCILPAICILASLGLKAQKAVVLEAFKKHQIDTAILHAMPLKNAEQYAFTQTTTLVTEDKKKISIAQYDPSLPADKRWKLISVDGGAPSRSDLNQFNKQHSMNVPPTRPADSSYKIVKDEGGYLVISYQYDPASLTEDNGFMKDLPTTLTINTQTRRLEQSVLESTKPFKIKLFKADYMNTNITYLFEEKYKEYLPLREEISLNLKILGRLAETTTIVEYSGYTRP